MTRHFGVFPSTTVGTDPAGRMRDDYVGPILSDEDVRKGRFCDRSGMWFPAHRLRTLDDGRVVGDVFYIEEGPIE